MRLNAEQSREFARRLFHLTSEEMERHNRINRIQCYSI